MASLLQRRFLPIVFVAALTLRLGAAGALRAWEDPVTWENGSIARALVAGHGFSFDYGEGAISRYFTSPRPEPTSFQAPFYPYLLAAFYLLGRHVGNDAALMLLLLLQAAVGAALVVPAYHLARRLFDHRAAAVSAGIAAVYPAFIYAATVLHQAVWCITGFAVAFLGLLSLRERPSVWRAALYGALLGLLLLVEPVFLGLAAAAWLGVILVGRERGRLAGTGAVAVAAALVVAAPWLVRCYVVHGHFVFVKSCSGFNLWQGNNPASRGSWRTGFTHVNYAGLPELQRRLRQADGEWERDAIWRAAALQEMKSAPARTAVHFVEKAVAFWTITLRHGLTANPCYWVPYGLLLVPALGTMIALRKRPQDYLPALMAFAAATLVYSTTFTGPRYRMPLEPLLFVFSAQGIVLVGARLAAWRRRVTRPAGV